MAMTFDMEALQRRLNPPRTSSAIPTFAPQTPEEWAARNPPQEPDPHDRDFLGRRINNDPNLTPAAPAPAAPAPAVATPAAPVPAATTPPATPETAASVQDYESANPTSRFDKDIRFTHTLSRMLGMAGLPQASDVRALNMQMQMHRVQDLAEQAQRAFIAGDIRPAIDTFNHAVPNGRQITGFAQNPNKSYVLRYADGTTETRTPAEIAEGLAAFGDPKMMGQMIVNRAKTLAEMQKDMLVAQQKGAMSFAQAIATASLNNQARMELAKFNATHGVDRVSLDAAGNISAVATHNGETFVPKKVKVGDTETTIWSKLNIPRSPAMGASPGTAVDPAAIPLPVPSQYAN